MLVLQEGKQVTDLIFEAKRILIAPTKNCGVEGLCAGIGLYKSLKASGKDSYLTYPYPIPDSVAGLLNKTDLTAVRGTRDLVVSIDFGGTDIEKVNYSVEGGICKIVVHPVPKDFDTGRVKFLTGGFNYDLVIFIGAQKLSDHDELFTEFEDELKKVPIINIDNSSRNENFATLNVVEPENLNLSQLVLYRVVSWRYKIDKEAATALLTGISYRKEDRTA